jgi:hypothetical protein
MGLTWGFQFLRWGGGEVGWVGVGGAWEVEVDDNSFDALYFSKVMSAFDCDIFFLSMAK